MKRVLILLTALFAALVAVAYATMFVLASPPSWAPSLLAVGANGIIASLMALGATRDNSLPLSLKLTFIGLFVVCAGAFVLALSMPADEGVGGPLLFGLPTRTAIVLYAVGVLPITVLPFAYAVTFESSTLSDADLTRVRAAHAAMQQAAVASTTARERAADVRS
jgi:hypothetical protein